MLLLIELLVTYVKLECLKIKTDQAITLGMNDITKIIRVCVWVGVCA